MMRLVVWVAALEATVMMEAKASWRFCAGLRWSQTPPALSLLLLAGSPLLLEWLPALWVLSLLLAWLVGSQWWRVLGEVMVLSMVSRWAAISGVRLARRGMSPCASWPMVRKRLLVVW